MTVDLFSPPPFGIEADTMEPVFAADGAFAGVIEQRTIAGPWYAKKRGEPYAKRCDCRACAIAYVTDESP